MATSSPEQEDEELDLSLGRYVAAMYDGRFYPGCITQDEDEEV